MESVQRGDPEQIGPYRVLGRLGTGGMGRVYLAEAVGDAQHGSDGARVAVKLVRDELADQPEFRKRFRQEVAAAQQVRGEYVAAVLDADVDAPRPWMAVKFVDGPTLQSLVDLEGALPAERVAGMAAQIAQALMDIHAEGVIHRDLKPGTCSSAPMVCA